MTDNIQRAIDHKTKGGEYFDKKMFGESAKEF
jgi:hypothetical protein